MLNRAAAIRATIAAWGLMSPALVIPAPAAEPDWPQWRGRAGDGHAPAAHDLPLTWSESENVAWKTPLPGRGWSSPVIGNGQVWVTTAVEQPATEAERERRLADRPGNQPADVAAAVRFRAIALDQANGRVIHEVELFTVADPQPIHALNSFASPSPVLADGRLFCHFGDFGAASVDTATGTVRWTNRELRLDHVNGPGSSPILWRDLLIVHLDGSDSQSIAAYRTDSGRLAWQTPRSGPLREDPDLKKAYATPLVIECDGRDVLVSPAADWVYGYDPATGEELWRLSYGVLGYSVVPRPVAAHGLVFLSTSFNRPELLAIRLAGPDKQPEIAWRATKAVPSMPSPLVVGDAIFMVNDTGVASCLDARSGTQLWTKRLGGNFSSSPILADGRIYVGNRSGETFVIEPGDTGRLLATNSLTDGIFATPAVADRALYLRTEAAVYRIEEPVPHR
ncbi:MAG: Serine/threonine-protein kinase AfsK [Planctomycetota bacterium]|jgi:outer membrane protein assembly factor BamB